MKKVLAFGFIIMLALSSESSAVDRDKAANKILRMDYIMEKAAEDISANVSLWVELRDEVDAATGEGWIYSLSVKIPSQPLGVIEVLARTGYPADNLCMPRFIEPEDYVVEEWSRRSIAALESFVMHDEKREGIRRDCLESIKDSADAKKVKGRAPGE